MKQLIFPILFLTLNTLSYSQTVITPIKKDKIDKYITYMEDENQDIGSISIFENGKEVYTRDFGQKNLSEKIENPLGLVYQIGSITKMFTTVLLAQLEEEGKISFDEPLSNYFPEMPNANNIKLRNMLNHRSGLGDYNVKNGRRNYWLCKPVSQSAILREIQKQGVLFQPDSSFAYSNSAYYLLALILEKKYNKSYNNIVKTQITEPLKLLHTRAIDSSYKSDNIEEPYRREKGRWSVMKDFYLPNLLGCGNMISTMKDLNIFLDALFSGELIKGETLNELLPKGNQHFGYGIMTIPFYEHIAYGHGGDTKGTHSVAAYNPENKLAISYSVNGENYPTNDFVIGIWSIIYDKAFSKPDFISYKADVTLFESYSGTYSAADFPLKIRVFEKGNKLMVKADEQPSLELTPSGKDKFRIEKAGITMEFSPNENTCIFQQDGQNFELKKLK